MSNSTMTVRLVLMISAALALKALIDSGLDPEVVKILLVCFFGGAGGRPGRTIAGRRNDLPPPRDDGGPTSEE